MIITVIYCMYVNKYLQLNTKFYVNYPEGERNARWHIFLKINENLDHDYLTSKAKNLCKIDRGRVWNRRRKSENMT